MLITKLKDKEKLASFIKEETPYIFKCFGCKEVCFPEREIDDFLLSVKDSVAGIARIDYLCNEEFTKNYLEAFSREVGASKTFLVFSCGVGVQVLAKLAAYKKVYPGCDTNHISGFQGVEAQYVDCEQCGSCYLNATGGICPLTACSKGLLNGACGGTNDGKCEVNPEMECGWALIYERLEKIGRKDILKDSPSKIRDYQLLIKK